MNEHLEREVSRLYGMNYSYLTSFEDRVYLEEKRSGKVLCVEWHRKLKRPFVREVREMPRRRRRIV